jgi:hypothetical protein
VWLDRLGDTSPQSYDLCAGHAARTQPPRGWQLRDRRPADERGTPEAPGRSTSLGGEDTVAVLAAALRAVPDLPEVGGSSAVEDVPADLAPAVDDVAPAVDDVAPAVDDDLAPAVDEDVAPAGDDRGDGRPERSSVDAVTVPEDEPSPVLGHGAAPKPILAARARTAPPPAPGDRAADW